MTSVTVTVSLLWCVQCQQCRPALSPSAATKQSMYRGAPLTPVKKSCHTSFHWSRNHTGNLHGTDRQAGNSRQVTCADRQTQRQTKRTKRHTAGQCVGGVVEGAQIIHKGAC